MSSTTDTSVHVLEARGLTVGKRLQAIDLRVGRGDGVGIVGRSGSGKSTLARALVGLEPGLRGSLRFGGHELVGAPRSAWARLRREVQLVWQDPLTALDPRLTIRRSLEEARVLAGRPRFTREDPRLAALLERVHLDAGLLERTPAALSGGQRQRAALARALSAEPSWIVADEVTSALDRPIAWQIVDLLKSLRLSGIGLLLVSHDLSFLAGSVDHMIVLDGGHVVEQGPLPALLERPAHAATRALVDAAPRLC